MNYPVLAILFIVISLPIWYVTGFAASSAELQRPTDVNIDSDINGVITITPNESYDIITADPDLQIGFEELPAESINQNSILELGDQNSPSENSAFTIQNSSTEELQLTFSLQPDTDYNGVNSDIRYTFEHNSGVDDIIVGESQTITLNPGESVDVSIRITTDQTTTDLSTIFTITGGDTNE